MKQMLLAVPFSLILLCASCSQEDYITVITDGAEAATVAATLALETTLPAEAPLIVSGLTLVNQTALDILAGTNTANETLTLQQLLSLAFTQDSNLAKYQAIVNFVLPILDDVPGISGALNTLVSKLNPTVLADVTAFFQGIQNGLGDAPGTTAQQVIDRSPKLKQAAKKMGLGKFDPQNLINALKTAAAKDAAKK